MAKLLFLIIAVVGLVLWFKAKGRKERELDAKPVDAVADKLKAKLATSAPKKEDAQ